MKKIIAAVFMLCFATVALAQEKNFIDQNYVVVNGYNKMKVTPNMIYISITINENDTKGKTSIDQMERNMINALTEIGIDVQKQLTIYDMSSNFKKYALKRPDIMQSKDYMLLVNDAVTATSVFLTLDGINISNATISSVDHSDLQNYKVESKVKAIQNAKEKAAAMAEGIGQEIGRAIQIVDNERGYYGVANQVMMRSMVAEDAAMGGSAKMSPVIQFQEIEIESNVSAYFVLK